VFKYVKDALGEISGQARKKYFVALFLQVSLPFLDLIGISLVGVLTLTLQKHSVPAFIMKRHFIPEVSVENLTIALLLGILLFFTLKGILAPYLLKKVTGFLALEAARISVEKSKLFFMKSLDFSRKQSLSEDFFRLGLGIFISIYDTLSYTLIIFSEVTMIIVLIIALFYVDSILSLFLIFYFSSTFYLIHRGIGSRLKRAWQNQIEANLESEKIFFDISALIREIRVYSLFERFMSNYSQHRYEQAKSRTEIIYYSMLPKYLYDIVFFLGLALLALLQGILSQNGNRVTSLVLFIAVGSRILPSLVRIQTSLGTISSSAAANRSWKLSLGISSEESEKFESNK